MKARALVLIALGAIGAALLAGRPAGLGVTLLAWALLAFAPRNLWTLAAAVLAAIATFRAAGWVVWPAVAAAAALGMLAGAGGSSWRQVAVGLLPRPNAAPFTALRVEPGGGWRQPLTAAGLGLLLLAVFLPLFASADEAFAHLLGELVPDNTVEQPLTRVAIWIGVMALGAALLNRTGARPAKPGTARLTRVEALVPLTVLVVLFAVFVAIQIVNLYGGNHVLSSAESYSDYAREGFAQLLIAAELTLGVIAAAVRWAPAGRARTLLLGALCLLTLAVLASALTRLGLYMDAFGFTPLRLAAQAAMLWIAAIFAALVVVPAAWLPRATVALTALAILAFAVSDPDRRIAERNLDRFERTGSLDESVLRNLSADAAPVLQARAPELATCDPEGDGLAGFNLARARC